MLPFDLYRSLCLHPGDAVRGLCLALLCAAIPAEARQAVTIDARGPEPLPQPVRAALGSDKRPDGETISVNSQYLLRNGKPWLPVMGEFHYSRVPREDWEAEILKMKAAGVQIISTYVIWIHQEEVQGQFDWSGRRDLHAFVALCAKHGMYVYPRIGPWAHGEARNGGLPDWVLANSPTRRNNPIYLAEVTTLFDQIGKQLRGELWKDGGPVIGIQLENEYRGDGTPGTGDDHIRTLKRIAIAAGMDVPLYTVTGWDGAAIPLDAVLPVYGGYPDAPWDGSPVKLPPNEVYEFRAHNRVGGNMGLIGGAGQNPASAYAGTPFLTAEIGGGLEDTYFRRPVVSADDIAAIPTVLLGSGANLLGFYMFQGGRNPQGVRSTLQESQTTGYPTDVPVRSYDFQASLGEFGEERPSFRRLKLVDYFLNDFGQLLAPMAPFFPAALPAGPSDLSVPRLSVRASGDHAFIFLNNYVRGYAMPARRKISVQLQLPTRTITVPSSPIDLPSGAYGIWPVNLDLGAGLTLRYSTAQLFHRFERNGEQYFCFFAIPGIAPEMALEAANFPVLASPGLHVRTEGSLTYLTASALRQPQQASLRGASLSPGSPAVHILLFSREQAESLWRVPGQGAPLLSDSQFYADEHTITLESDGDPDISFALLRGTPQPMASAPLGHVDDASLWQRYTARLHAIHPEATLHPLSPGSPRDPLHNGPSFSWRKQPIPMAPADAEFQHAATWALTLPQTHDPQVNDLRLVLDYNGDIARLRSGDTLLDDNFWNGRPWNLSLRDLDLEGAGTTVTLQVLPWPKNPPFYLEAPVPPSARGGQLPQTPQVRVVPQYRLQLRVVP